MTQDNMNWREKILDALERERSAVPGRVGETPLSDLASELSQLSVSRQSEVVEAITELVTHPDIESMGGDGKEYWSGLSFLTKYLSGIEKEALRSAFQTKLFDHVMRKNRLSVYALHGFIAAGGRLFPDQWQSLEEIRQDAPVAWLGAAVMSCLFDEARENALQMLREEKLNLASFLLGMDAWCRVWDERGNFKRLMKEFRDAAPSPEGKKKFTKWLERRGFLDDSIEQRCSRRPNDANTICAFTTRLAQNSPGWEVEKQNHQHPALA